MNFQDHQRRIHLQTKHQTKTFAALSSKNFAKQVVALRETTTRAFSEANEAAESRHSTSDGESLTKDEKWSKNTSGWQSSSRSRHCGVRTTRQLRRNERERGRKARLNAAFQVLRSVVPNTLNSSGTVSERKMTQVEILRLAKNYISNLTELLQEDNKHSLRTFNSLTD